MMGGSKVIIHESLGSEYLSRPMFLPWEINDSEKNEKCPWKKWEKPNGAHGKRILKEKSSAKVTL